MGSCRGRTYLDLEACFAPGIGMHHYPSAVSQGLPKTAKADGECEGSKAVFDSQGQLYYRTDAKDDQEEDAACQIRTVAICCCRDRAFGRDLGAVASRHFWLY